MKSIVKLVGISSCCIALGAAAANADPVPLADAELDRVAAGAFDTAVSFPKLSLAPRALVLRYETGPLRYEPGQPIPIEGPGCHTGGGPCQPQPSLVPLIDLSDEAPVGYRGPVSYNNSPQF